MSRKFSEYFKANPKVPKSNEKVEKIIKNKEKTAFANLPEIHECFVTLKDINSQFDNKLNLFEEISVKSSTKNIKNIKREQNSCKFCKRELSTKQSLRTHLKDIHSDKLNLVSCSICTKKFIKELYLKLHMKTKHPGGKVEQLECDFNGKCFKSKGELNSHMKVHLPLIECQFCSRIVKLYFMNNHLKNFHAIDKKFKCKICSKFEDS